MDSFQCLRAIEVPKEQLTIIRELGEGQFGKVFQGSIRSPMTGTVTKVAIKMLTKVEHSAQDHFFLEAMTMRKFSHPHIIRLLGVVSQTQPISLIMEIAEHGELRSFLQQNQMKLQLDNLLLYCYQIANALEYLASKQVVHRDIAARNCLVFNFELVKLADFGLSRLMQDHNYYRARSKGKMPIKWMAPESIFYRRFTSASDVWMFAVCCWEIFMFGVKPYQGMKNQKIVECIEGGQKLARPNTCPKNVYATLEQCWAMKEFERPNFTTLNQKFKLLYEQYAGTSVDKLSENRPNSGKNSANDQQIAEKEFELLRERLEMSLNQTIDDSNWLMKQEKQLPFKINNKNIYKNVNIGNSQSKLTPDINSMRIGSGDSSTFLVASSSSRSSSLENPENLSTNIKTEFDSNAAEICQLVYQVCSNLARGDIDSKVQNQPLVFEIGSKVRELNQFVKTKFANVSSQESQIVATMCCRILESDAQEIIRGFRLVQQRHQNQNRELLIACNILIVDLKNSIEKISTLLMPTKGSRIISHSSV
ncbi:focal adhesion kinase 1-like isoform X2 [Symsagittifera roscoffensis]